MIKLTESQKKELIYAYRVYQRTVNTIHYPDGRADRMRCGQSLERLGQVEWANQYSYNRYKRYRITEKGIEYVENVLLRDNDKANAQIAACIHKNDGQLER